MLVHGLLHFSIPCFSCCVVQLLDLSRNFGHTHAPVFFFVMVYWKMFIEVSRMLTIEGSWTRWSLTKEYVVLASIELDQVKGETEHTRLRLVLFDVH